MTLFCRDNLIEISKLISSINQEQYTYKSYFLSNSTIGQHVRHILEFYLCLRNGPETGKVNYDNRERNMNIENDLEFAQQIIDKICSSLTLFSTDTVLFLEGNFSAVNQGNTLIKTSLKRELAYCLEHSIHHQALVKTALLEQKLGYLITDNFGVAPATIRYKEECAQ